jgi:hypothetical protein
MIIRKLLQAPGGIFLRVALVALLPLTVEAGVTSKTPPPPSLYVSFIDQTSPQTGGPAVNRLDERRRGPIFAAALQQSVQAGKLPPISIINRDLSMPSTLLDEPKVPAGKTLARIYLTQWSQTRLGGIADTEILCRFYVDVVRDGQVKSKLGPFFASGTLNVDFPLPEDLWAQYQAVARKAIDNMALALTRHGDLRR